ncbi:DUF1524 domain-containing protein, partial [Methanosalsum natronophilum]
QRDYTEQDRERLAWYIANNCYLVIVTTTDEESAYRIFSVLNDRGIQLSHADILKAEIISQISSSESRTEYNNKWVEMEEELGVDQFKTLFSHIRMIRRKAKARDTILKEIRTYIDPKKKPEQFIDNELIPYGNAFRDIKTATFEASKSADKINEYLKLLNRLDNEDWIPPAIYVIAQWGDSDTSKVLNLIEKIERLAFGMHILRNNINDRIERYSRILDALEKNDFDSLESTLELTETEKENIKTTLKGDVYHTKFIRYLLLRIDGELSDSSAVYDHPILSIEHVLPQNPANDSEWISKFPDLDEREELTNSLGNLVLLSTRKNSKARNYDFKKKKEHYFKKGGVSPFTLTTQVLNYDDWTPESIYERQKNLEQVCANILNI